MTDPDDHPPERIEALEAHIEELGEKIARSRRLATAGGVAAVAGAFLLVALLVGFVLFTPARVLGALAALIGGVVLAGSSASSTAELERALARAERERDLAIDALGLVADDAPRRPGRVIPFRSRAERP